MGGWGGVGALTVSLARTGTRTPWPCGGWGTSSRTRRPGRTCRNGLRARCGGVGGEVSSVGRVVSSVGRVVSSVGRVVSSVGRVVSSVVKGGE